MFMMEAKMTLSKMLAKLEIVSNGNMPDRIFQSSTMPSSNFEIQFKPLDDEEKSLKRKKRLEGKVRSGKSGKCPFGHS